jgi:hypothetical protein
MGLIMLGGLRDIRSRAVSTRSFEAERAFEKSKNINHYRKL